jgi:hypothetical protein
MISRAMDSGGRLPLRHMRKCDDCRLFHERSVRLGEALRAEAKGYAAAPAALPIEARAGRRRLRLAVGIAAAAAACIVAILIAYTQRGGGTDAPPEQPAPGRLVSPQQPRRGVPPEDRRPPRRAASVPGPSLLAQAGGDVASFADVAREPLRRQLRNLSDTAAEAGRTLIFCLAIDPSPAEEEAEPPPPPRRESGTTSRERQ